MQSSGLAPGPGAWCGPRAVGETVRQATVPGPRAAHTLLPVLRSSSSHVNEGRAAGASGLSTQA